MHDLKALRDDPGRFDKGWARRGLAPQAAAILDLDKRLRAVVQANQDAQTERNQVSKAIGQAKAQGDEAAADAAMARVGELKEALRKGEETEREARAVLEGALSGLPNLPADEAPDGADEAENVLFREWGDVTRREGPQHFDVGEGLGQLEFDRAAKLSGARFALLRGDLARLERALAAFMLDLHVEEHDYEEIAPPALVRGEALFGTGQLPKFEEDQFKTRDDDLWLIPTAEVVLTNMVREEVLDASDLPMRLTAHTPCFRREAGSAGRDTRGLVRLHQFSKVELVSITTPEDGEGELDRMTMCAEEVLKRLELPFRTMALCTGDMGFSARKTYDLEVWLPGQGAYREISSCSHCGDFQARRMNARFKRAPSEAEPKPKPEFLHTLNGSGLAVGRTLVAVLENYEEGGAVVVPDVLRPYMGGLPRIEKVS